MGRKINVERREAVLRVVAEHDGQVQSAEVAKILELHPQAVARVLISLEDEAEKHVCEDDKGFLSIFKLW